MGYKGKLLFYANDCVHGDELWRSDGYKNGTMLVRDINPGSDGSDGSQLIEFNNYVYFTANDGTSGHELYKTDGTLSGTMLLKDLCTGTCSGSPNFFTKFTPPIVGGVEELYFTANMGVDGAQLWITDGTQENTRRAFQHVSADIDIDEKSHHLDFPPALAVYHGSLYWSGNEGRADIELPRGFGAGNGNDQGVLGLENAIVIEDVDIASDLFHIKLSCNKGYLTLSKTAGLTFSDGDGMKDRQMKFTANVTNVNEAFRWLQYQAVPDENGEDEILIVVNDTAHNGAYDTWEESKNVIHVWIEEKNDAPTIVRAPNNPEKYFAPGTNTGTGQPMTNTATLGILSVVDGFVVADIDMDHLSHIWITLEAEYGMLTLNSLRGLNFGGKRGHGTGINNPSMSFSGTLTDVNNALYRLRYMCKTGDGCAGTKAVPGKETITISARDIDLSGKFELLTVTETVELDVISPDLLSRE